MKRLRYLFIAALAGSVIPIHAAAAAAQKADGRAAQIFRALRPFPAALPMLSPSLSAIETAAAAFAPQEPIAAINAVPAAPLAALPAVSALPAAAALAATAERSASLRQLREGPFGDGKAAGYEHVRELKLVLADGTTQRDGSVVAPFGFRTEQGLWSTARSAGLEGFLYRKLELERSHGAQATVAQLEDYFKYFEALLSPYAWTATLWQRLQTLRRSPIPDVEKNAGLNALLIEAVRDLQAKLWRADQSLWLREANTYMILARAYNRLRPGQNFFDSLDDAELERVKAETKAGVIWILDMFDIGEIRRWGTGGGSPYSIKGYRVKPELGGEAAFRRFTARAHAHGLKICVDEIPNHVSLDSDLVNRHPEALLHIVPPQNLSDAEILAGVPKNGAGDPAFFLIHTDNYPENGRRVKKKILIQHPVTDYGGGMWIDMAQRDYSRQLTRDWEAGEAARMFGDWGVDMVRRDMSYEVLRDRYFERWRRILGEERDHSTGWARAEMDALLAGFEARWQARAGAEFLEQATRQPKLVNPAAAMIDEAYTHNKELSRSGSSAIYNKADFDASMGQIGLYDALQSAVYDGGVSRLIEALRNIAFRLWQKGGAALVNFIGTHDGGEGNPFDKFGSRAKAAAVTALLMRPTLTYNGIEQGVGQALNLSGDLAKSVDLQKAIPFDIPVSINWDNVDPSVQRWLRTIWAKAEEHKRLFSRGALDVLDPHGGSSIAAWSVAGDDESGRRRVLIGAANFAPSRSAAVFYLGKRPVLADFGAFQPRPGKLYILRDQLHRSADGRPATYTYKGSTLIERGLPIALNEGDAHLFEVEELDLP